MIKCCSFNVLEEPGAAHDTILQAQAAGFTGLEAVLAAVPPEQDEQAWLTEQRHRLTQLPLPIYALTSAQAGLFDLAGAPAVQEPARQMAQRLIHLAAALPRPDPVEEVTVVIGAGGCRPGVRPVLAYEDAFNRLFFAWEELKGHAEAAAVRLALESPGAGLLLSPLELRDFVDRLGSGYVSICYCPFDVQELYEPLEALRLLGARTAALRLPLAATHDDRNGPLCRALIQSFAAAEVRPRLLICS